MPALTPQPTKGAVRAARRIIASFVARYLDDASTRRNVAEIIDSETCAAELLQVVKCQQRAIDQLFSRISDLDPAFSPTMSGEPWTAIQKGSDLIARLTQ